MNCCCWKSSRNRGKSEVLIQMGHAESRKLLCARLNGRRILWKDLIGDLGNGWDSVELQGVLELLMLEGVCWNSWRLCEHRSSVTVGIGSVIKVGITDALPEDYSASSLLYKLVEYLYVPQRLVPICPI